MQTFTVAVGAVSWTLPAAELDGFLRHMDALAHAHAARPGGRASALAAQAHECHALRLQNAELFAALQRAQQGEAECREGWARAWDEFRKLRADFEALRREAAAARGPRPVREARP